MKKIILLFLLLFPILILASEGSLENLKSRTNNTESIVEAILEIDEYFGINSEIAKKRLTLLKNEFQPIESQSEVEKMLHVVEFLRTTGRAKFENNEQENLDPYSLMISKEKWDCRSVSIDFDFLATLQGIKSNLMTFPNHVNNITRLDGKEWVVDLSIPDFEEIILTAPKDKTLTLDKFKEVLPDLTNNNDLSIYGKPLSKNEYISEYLIQLGIYFADQLSKPSEAEKIYMFSKEFNSDSEKASYYIAISYFLRLDFKKAEKIFKSLKNIYYKQKGLELLKGFN